MSRRLELVTPSTFACRLCGRVEPEPLPRCPSCHRHDTFEAPPDAENDGDRIEPVKLVPFAKAGGGKKAKLLSFHKRFDSLFGGGFRRGGTYLIGGEWGSGKSSLVLQLIERAPGRVRYVCAEEPAEDVRERAERIGLSKTAHIFFAEGTEIEPSLLDGDVLVNVIDSAHGMTSVEADGPAGDQHQVASVVRHIVAHTKETRSISLVLMHLAKDGSLKGSTEAPHAVTAVSELEKLEDGSRCWRVLKCRHGATHNRVEGKGLVEQAIRLEMTDRGLVPMEAKG